MRIVDWARKLVDRVVGKPDPELEKLKLAWEAEKGWLREQIKEYNSADRRLAPLTSTLTGETAEHLAWYKTALKEPTVKAAILTKVFAVAQLDLTVKAAERNERDQEIADYNRDNILKSKGGLRHVVESMLLGALTYGYSISEKVRGKADRGKWNGKIVLKHLKSKDTSDGKIQLVVDEFKNVTGVRANVNNERTDFKAGDFVIFTYLKFFENPLGMSDLRAVYRASTLKEAAIRLRMIFLDKYTGPFMVGKHAEKSTRASLMTALAQARQSGYITLNAADDVQVLDLAVKGTSDFKQAIDDFDREILIGVNFASLPTLEGQTPSGRGDTKVQRGTADLAVWYLAELVADAINDQIIPDFTDLNYAGRPGLPMANLGGVDAAAVAAELANLRTLHDMGGDLDMDEVYERANASVPKEGARILKGMVPAPPGMPFADPPSRAGGPAVPFDDLAPPTPAGGDTRTGTPFPSRNGS